MTMAYVKKTFVCLAVGAAVNSVHRDVAVSGVRLNLARGSRQWMEQHLSEYGRNDRSCHDLTIIYATRLDLESKWELEVQHTLVLVDLVTTSDDIRRFMIGHFGDGATVDNLRIWKDGIGSVPIGSEYSFGRNDRISSEYITVMAHVTCSDAARRHYLNCPAPAVRNIADPPRRGRRGCCQATRAGPYDTDSGYESDECDAAGAR